MLAQSLSAAIAALTLYLHLYLLGISFSFVKKFVREVCTNQGRSKRGGGECVVLSSVGTHAV